MYQQFVKQFKRSFINVSDIQNIYVYESFKDVPEFINWNKNRHPDESRINELKLYYSKNNTKVIPGIIYGWQKNSKSKVEIYDGIHRILAASQLYKETQQNFTILLSILKTEDENVVISDFRAINKSCPVPILYTEETSIYKKNVCEYVINKLCENYKAFVSPSRKPFQYNFNRDVTLEWLSEFDIDWTLNGLQDIILQELNGLNHAAKNFVLRNNIKSPKKCEFHKFYLWYLEKDFIKRKIETSIKEVYYI
jgi:hypothetical protein